MLQGTAVKTQEAMSLEQAFGILNDCLRKQNKAVYLTRNMYWKDGFKLIGEASDYEDVLIDQHRHNDIRQLLSATLVAEKHFFKFKREELTQSQAAQAQPPKTVSPNRDRKSPESTSSDSAGHSGSQPSSEHNSPPLPPAQPLHKYLPTPITAQFSNAVITSVKARTCKNPLVPLSADERKQLEHAMDYLNGLKIHRTDGTMIFFEFDTPTRLGCEMIEEIDDWRRDNESLEENEEDKNRNCCSIVDDYFCNVQAINESKSTLPKVAMHA